MGRRKQIALAIASAQACSSPTSGFRMDSHGRWRRFSFMEGAASMSLTAVLSEAASDDVAGRSAILALRQSRIPALRSLRVEESPTGITITGRVATYYLKQLAQETVMPVLNDRELHNEVLVVRG
jgi:hypothetical protein